jgi:hypothetical protein
MADVPKLVADLSALTLREAAELAELLKDRWNGTQSQQSAATVQESGAWTYEEIDREWLVGAKIAASPEEIVASFERCERVLGREWIESAGSRGALRMTGAIPVLRITSMGTKIAALNDVENSKPLIDKIRLNEPSAFAELSAIHLLSSAGDTQIELEPTTDGNRKCDFRIQRHDEGWVYVEVTRPDLSDAQARIQQVLQSICNEIVSIKKTFALEVFFRREPEDSELLTLLADIRAFCSAEQVDPLVKAEMPSGMGLLILGREPTGQVVVSDHGEEVVPRLGAARAIVGPGEPNRHVSVRMPYADQRAERFLTAEARQLAHGAPGLIMVDMAEARGGFRTWEAIIQRRFQPTMHTRVGGVVLFAPGSVLTDQGLASLCETKLISNQHARIPLPPWIASVIETVGKQFQTATRRFANITEVPR